MLKGSKSEDLSSSVRCLESRDMPAVFLRLQLAREQVALPYSSLIKLELKNDATAVELSYVTHRVMIAGRNLAEIYQAVAEAQARLAKEEHRLQLLSDKAGEARRGEAEARQALRDAAMPPRRR